MRTTLALALCGLAAAVPVAGATPAPGAQIDVSSSPALQAEATIAVDPENGQSLLAGSNSIGEPADGYARVYTSADGGQTWTSVPGPPPLGQQSGPARCSIGDPAVAFGRGGRQYYAFLSGPCGLELEGRSDTRITLEVAARAGSSSPWRTAAVFPVRSKRFDDKPAIAVDVSPSSPHAGRVYVAWSRTTPVGGSRPPERRTRIVVSSSDDGGATWTKPVSASDGAVDASPVFATLALDRAGTLFVGWTDSSRRLFVTRSVDGGATFAPDLHVDTAVGLPGPVCLSAGMSVPAQAHRCITPTPTVAVDDRDGAPERVYLTYGAPGPDGREFDVFASVFDANLTPLLGSPAGPRVQVNPPDGPVAADEFLPVAAVDPANGDLWVCYYDSAGDRRRERVRYTCTASADGGATWAKPVAAASTSSNLTVSDASLFQYGDYEGLAVSGGVAHPIWTDSRDLATLSEEIYTTVLTGAQLQLP